MKSSMNEYTLQGNRNTARVRLFGKGTDKQPGGVQLHTDYAASPLSDGLVIIATHSALLFRNHYEAQVRSLTSFSAADL